MKYTSIRRHAHLCIMFLVLTCIGNGRAQVNVNDFREGFSFPRITRDKLLQAGIAIGEVGTTVVLTKSRNRFAPDPIRLAREAEDIEQLNIIRERMRSNRNLLELLTGQESSLRSLTPEVIKSRLEAANNSLVSLSSDLQKAEQVERLRAEAAELQNAIAKESRLAAELTESGNFQEADNLMNKLRNLRQSADDRLKSLQEMEVKVPSSEILRTQVQSTELEIKILNDALTTGKYRGAPIASYTKELTLVQDEIQALNQLVEADFNRIGVVAERLKGQTLRRLLRVDRLIVLADALFILDAASRIGYLINFNDNPGYVGIDDTLFIIREVAIQSVR